VTYLPGGFPLPVLISLGVDWITVSQHSGWPGPAFTEIGGPILAEEQSLGNRLKPWSSCGYEGYHCGQCDLGTRADGQLIRLSGERAFNDWRRVLKHASGCSRLDLQATIHVGTSVASEVMRVYRQARSYRPKIGKPAIISLLTSTDGSRTVYLGKRSSAQMGRVYDKFLESGNPAYQDCIRFEVEFKKRRARGIAFYLFSCPDERGAMAAELSGFFSERGVSSRLFRSFGQLLLLRLRIDSSPFATDDSRSLRWLESSVRKTVEHLVGSGLVKETLDALGLSDYAVPGPDGGEGG